MYLYINFIIMALTTLFGFGYGAYAGFGKRIITAILILVFGGKLSLKSKHVFFSELV